MRNALIVPTRNRVENAQRLRRAFYETSQASDLFFVVGTEDPRLKDYLDAFPAEEILVFPERGLVRALNFAAPRLAYEYDYLSFMGDDHVPRTRGWDYKLASDIDFHCVASSDATGYYSEVADPDRKVEQVGFAYGNDLLQGPAFPTHVLMTSNIVKTLGYFTHPRFEHLCCDLVWRDLGQATNTLVYDDKVIIEHMHPYAGKSEWDDGYREVNSSQQQAKDTEAYFAWREQDMPSDVRKLQTLTGKTR